jgi:hypothetical protein
MLPYQEVREDGRSCSNASELNGAITGTWRAGCACGRSQKESKVLLHHSGRAARLTRSTKRMKCITTRSVKKLRVARPLKANSMLPSPP